MAFLDESGLAHFWEKVKAALSGKQNTLTAGDGLSKEGDTLNVDTPVKPVTKAEYDALPEADKQSDTMYAITDDNEDGGSSGGSGGGSYEEIYSTEETRIGTWIDGKPVYRKTYFKESDSYSTGAWHSLFGPLPDVKTVVSLTGSFEYAAEKFPVPLIITSGNTMAFRYSNGYIDAFSLDSNYAQNGKNYHVTIEYTKTTDAALAQEVTQ